MEMTEDFYIKKLESMFNFYFKKYGRVVEIDELGHADRDPVKEKTRQKNQKNILVVSLLDLTPMKNILVSMI